MIVMGVDPGLAKLGWAVVQENQEGSQLFLGGGVIRTKGTPKKKRKMQGLTSGEDKLRRALELAQALGKEIAAWKPMVICHESMSLGFHQATTLFDMGLAFGVMAATALSEGLQLVSVTPAEIKLAMCGDKKAEKVDVINAAERLFPDITWPKATGLWEHQADALGAIVHFLKRPAF